LTLAAFWPLMAVPIIMALLTVLFYRRWIYKKHHPAAKPGDEKSLSHYFLIRKDSDSYSSCLVDGAVPFPKTP